MKKLRYLMGALAALALVGIAYAQTTIPIVSAMGLNDVIQVIRNQNPQAGNQYATHTLFKAWLLGGNSAHNGTPVLTSCGGGSPAVVGTDNAFTITQGTTATGCVATFAQAFVTAPTCVAVNQTAPGTSTPAYTVSTTAITLVTASTSGEIWNVICVSKPGG